MSDFNEQEQLNQTTVPDAEAVCEQTEPVAETASTVGLDEQETAENAYMQEDQTISEAESSPDEAGQTEPDTQEESDGAGALTLDEIRDPESLIFVNKAKKLLEQLETAQKDKSRLTGEVKQSEKNVGGMEKNVAEGITAALKKKKEEIAATYDKELSQYQDQIDVCKTDRAKAKANAIAQRIQTETAPLNQQNQEIEAQIDMKFKENKVPMICKKRAISILFFPKMPQDWFVDILISVILLFLIPLFFVLTMSESQLLLAAVFFIYTACIFAAYMFVLHKYMLKFANVNEEVEELRKAVQANNKSKQTMANRIRKSQDETGYNLGGFDDKIAEIQKLMQDTVAKRQEALENFEDEIRHQITADITAANKDELQNLQQAFEEKRQELKDKTDEIKKLEGDLKENYEHVLGKDLLYKQKLGSLDVFCQEHPELDIKDAVVQYKSSKK